MGKRGWQPYEKPEYFNVKWYDEQKKQKRTDPEIAEELLISIQLLNKWKKQIGCEAYKYKNIKSIKKEDKEMIWKLYQQGVSGAKIAEVMGKHSNTIYHHIRKLRKEKGILV